MDVGRADGGRTFVRVIHLPTGQERTQVGLNGEPVEVVGKRLAQELLCLCPQSQQSEGIDNDDDPRLK